MSVPSLKRIVETTARHFSVSTEEVFSKCRTEEVAHARHVAIFMALEQRQPKRNIALAFKRNLEAIGYARRKVQDMLSVYPELREDVEELRAQFSTNNQESSR